MCGICGLVNGDPSRHVDVAVVERMNAALIHRGPDDAGVWHGGHATLAMRRLSILDLAGGHQPMTNEDGSVIVIFNGEIYNFRALRDDLIAQGHAFRSQSDTEVIVHAYEEYGDDMLQRLNGMFAMAVYDVKQKRLLLARDRLGIKPLFYCERNGSLAFASELDALLRSGLVRKRIDPSALDAYFSFLYIPAPDCIFEDVRKLRPGEKLVFENGKAALTRYWRLAFNIDNTWTLEAAAERYRDLLADAIRLQRVSDVPLGAFLSGGIDSSTVAGMMSRAGPGPVKTFTIGFEDAAVDEIRYARTAAKYFHTDHSEEILRPDMVDVTSRLVRHFGEPFADSSAVPTWLVSKLARSSVTVVLSGDGGDELFAGYTWLHMNRNVATYRRIPKFVRSLLDLALHCAPGSRRIAKLRRFSHDSSLSPQASFRRRETCFNADMRAALYHREWSGRIAADATDRFEEHAQDGPLSPDDWMLYQDSVMYLPDDILTKVDRMSMAHSLEVRVPLLDHRIVEFAATVPFALKFKGGVSKYLAKHAVRDLLPKELLHQRKQGFAIPVHRWFREDLRAFFQELVLSKDARCGEYLNPGAVQSLLNGHTAHQEDYGHHLWAILMLEQWLRYVEATPTFASG